MKNEPAFPIFATEHYRDYNGSHTREVLEQGLTKREYFAGLAMQGILSGNTAKQIEESWSEPKKLILDCLILADALIAELEKEKKDE